MYIFNQNNPDLIIVDNFYKNPYEIINLANSKEFKENDRYYKGLRSEKILLPYIKEEFERLIGKKIVDWLSQPMNGVFQKTTINDPIVYHSDNQMYAGVVYLTPNLDDCGTSFWKDKKYGRRLPANDHTINSEIYSQYNLLHEDNWELVDRVGSVFNRLVLWNGKLIHSATKYSDQQRLIHLYFFNVEK